MTGLDIEIKSQAFEEAGGAWPLFTDQIRPWATARDQITNDQLDSIIRIGQRSIRKQAQIFSGQHLETRDSKVGFLFPGEYTGWIFANLTQHLIAINQQFFGFELTGFEQGLQFTEYTAPGQHYDWHTDRGMNIGIRKLSIVLQLSDPSDYEGGDLILQTGQEETMPRDRGTMIVFPSWTLHKVTPVTAGTRYSLVAWVSGPAFK